MYNIGFAKIHVKMNKNQGWAGSGFQFFKNLRKDFFKLWVN